MSDTPRTDAAQWTAGVGDDDRTVVWSDFARELEGEIARLKEWNAQRTGQFACTEQKLATQIAKLTEWLERRNRDASVLRKLHEDNLAPAINMELIQAEDAADALLQK